MKKIEYILLLAACLLFFDGCVKENLDDCPPLAGPGTEEGDERYLYFRLRNSTSTFEREVENLTLFAYDGNNQYVKDTILSGSDLQASSYRFNMTDWKTDGEEFHHMIGVMNLSDNYLIENEHHKLEFRQSVVTTRPDTVDYPLENIYLGNIEFKVPVKAVLYDTLELVHNINHVLLEIEFQNGCQMPENSTIIPVLRGTNGTYNAFNECVGQSRIVYEPHTYLSQVLPVLRYSFTTLKMYIGDDLDIVIQRYEDGKLESVQEVTLRLTEYLSQLVDSNGKYLYATDEDLEIAAISAEDPYVIRILLDCDFAIAEIRVNNWFVVGPGVDL